MDTLNKKIKEIRKSKGLTQEQMAKKLGITQSGYQQIESGNSDSMRVTTLRKICLEFNLSSDDLLGIKRKPATAYDLAVRAVLEKNDIPVKGVKIAGESLTKRKTLHTKKATTEE